MQKGFIVLAISFLFSFNLSAQSIAKLTSSPVKEAVSWNTEFHDYGDIPQNIPAPVEFVMTNNSDQPIIITKVKGSCGCTATKHDDAPVLPGASTVITATYNAKQAGPFIKKVNVTTSDGGSYKLQLKGNVVKGQE